MSFILQVALLEVRRMRRNNMTWLVLACSLFVLFLMDAFHYFTIEDQIKMIQDFSLGIMNLLSLILVIYYPIQLIKEELQQKTIYNLLSKPIGKHHIILGKAVAVIFLIGMAISFNAISLFILLLMKGGTVDLRLVEAIFLIFLKNVILVGFSIFFGLLPLNLVIGTICSIAVFCLGTTKDFLKQTFQLSGASHLARAGIEGAQAGELASGNIPWSVKFTEFILSGVPNFRMYDLTEYITLGNDVPTSHLVNCFLHFIGVSLIIYTLSYLVFTNKEL